MIPREILKKIRQIEIRTNRIVRASAAGARASARFTDRILATSKSNLTPNSACTVKRRERRAPAILSLTPGFSPVTHDLECLNRFNGFPRTEKPLKRLSLVRLADTGLKPGVNENRNPAADHFQPYFSFISAWICSNGIPSWGFFSESAIRRSSSTACSGVISQSYPFSMIFDQTCCASSRRSARLNLASTSAFKVFHGNFPPGIGGAFQSWKPSMNSSQSRCASSTRSSNGSFFAAAKNFFTDMASKYFFAQPAQAIGSSFYIHPSSFPPA